VRYVALLRGVNVGGRSRIEMPRFKRALEGLGLSAVSTYINSGNAIFETKRTNPRQLEARMEAALDEEFGRPVRVLVLSAAMIARIDDALPRAWTQGGKSLCNVWFLWPEADRADVLQQLPEPNAEVEELLYVPGAVFHRRDAAKASRARAGRITGSELYKNVTVRNANTLHKLRELAER
jgi:uncharacterized protein (DUF1697 family)